VVLDSVAPQTQILAVAAATSSPSISVPFSAADDRVGVSAVEIWYRYRPDASSAWDAWTLGSTAAASPGTFAFPSGDGLYELYSIGVDRAGNREAAPAAADQPTKFDRTPPASQAGTLSASYSTATVAVPYAATDTVSGVATVELWSRYRLDASSSWGNWTLGPTGTGSPLTFTFGADGLYEFYTIAIDSAGNRELAPAAADAQTTKVSGGWTSATRVNIDQTANATDPHVAIAPGNIAYGVWVRGVLGPDQDVWFSRRNASTGAWGPDERVNNVVTGNQFWPSITTDTNANAYVVWADDRVSSNRDIYFSKRSASTGTWTPSVKVNDDTKAVLQSQPAIAVSASGVAIAVWVDGRNKEHIYASRLPAGATTWSANMKVTSNAATTKQVPDVAIGPDGTAYAVWVEPASGNADIWFATLAPGATVWSANTKISDDPGTAYQGSPRIGVDNTGKLTVVWDDWRVSAHQLRARQRAAGSSTWTPSVVVSAAGSNSPSLGVRADGRAYVAWYDGINAQFPNIWGSTYDPGTGTWATPEQLNQTTNPDEYRSPSVGIGPTLQVVLFQRRTNGVTLYEIYSRTK
jgi:hypothetical protein